MESFLQDKITLHCGDCISVLSNMPDNSVDSCVCDPPYHLTSIVKRFGNETMSTSQRRFAKTGGADRLPGTDQYGRLSTGFMGKKWDGGDIAFRTEVWEQVFRVLKPGGHLAAFSGTRTYHRMACAIEDAGFEIRDQIGWAYGSGFPKSHDVSKGIDRTLGAERDKVPPRSIIGHQRNNGNVRPYMDDPEHMTVSDIPATAEAQQWSGWGTALKPAFEPIVFCSKPLTVRQFIAIYLEVIAMEMAECLSLSAIDAAKIFTDSQARSKKVEADIVLAHAKMHVLESIETASFVELLSTSIRASCADQEEMPASSALENAKENGNQSTTREQTTHFGEVEDFLKRLTDITMSVLTGDTSENIATSWSKFSVDVLSERSMYTIATATRLIIGLKTLKSSLQQSTSEDTGSFSPSWQSIVLARKPLSEATVAANVLRWGTGAINVDGCRVGDFDPDEMVAELMSRFGETSAERRYSENGSTNFALTPGPRGGSPKGRWPANLVHDGSEEVLVAFPDAAGQQGALTGNEPSATFCGDVYGKMARTQASTPRGDGGSSARFFYNAKADSDDRIGSKHPTVKPVDLMQWLVRLVTPPGGMVLDLFAGTGTTGEAAWREGMSATLIEREEEYQDDIRRRMALTTAGPEERARESIKAKTKDKPVDAGPLFGGT